MMMRGAHYCGSMPSPAQPSPAQPSLIDSAWLAGWLAGWLACPPVTNREHKMMTLLNPFPSPFLLLSLFPSLSPLSSLFSFSLLSWTPPPLSGRHRRTSRRAHDALKAGHQPRRAHAQHEAAAVLVPHADKHVPVLGLVCV